MEDNADDFMRLLYCPSYLTNNIRYCIYCTIRCTLVITRALFKKKVFLEQFIIYLLYYSRLSSSAIDPQYQLIGGCVTLDTFC